MSVCLLDIFRSNRGGITREKLLTECKQQNIANPLPMVRVLYQAGMIAIRTGTKEIVFQATEKAFGLSR